MAGIDDILSQLPIGDIAKKLGVDEGTAAQAVKEGGATIIGGLHRNAESADGAAAIEKALENHGGQIDVDNVDTADGQKILTHIFGNDTDAVASQLSSNEKTAGIDFSKLLPILAPIVMGMLSKGTSNAKETSSGGLGDVLGGLLGGLTGNQSGNAQSSGGGIDIGSILGGLGGLFGKK
ncbi:DUF937 domain-containing protein [Microbacterium gorillae]|uniref:DUF937 domain-containing protein n=1 Tax=Microbacterium gorillae TaxID=1231063 RepID=UPI0005905DC6|nr:DUF937 domain-containing protein [Microbacterium gorillae]